MMMLSLTSRHFIFSQDKKCGSWWSIVLFWKKRTQYIFVNQIVLCVSLGSALLRHPPWYRLGCGFLWLLLQDGLHVDQDRAHLCQLQEVPRGYCRVQESVHLRRDCEPYVLWVWTCRRSVTRCPAQQIPPLDPGAHCPGRSWHNDCPHFHQWILCGHHKETSNENDETERSFSCMPGCQLHEGGGVNHEHKGEDLLEHKSAISFTWTCAPFLVSLVTFAVNVLDVQKDERRKTVIPIRTLWKC